MKTFSRLINGFHDEAREKSINYTTLTISHIHILIKKNRQISILFIGCCVNNKKKYNIFICVFVVFY